MIQETKLADDRSISAPPVSERGAGLSWRTDPQTGNEVKAGAKNDTKDKKTQAGMDEIFDQIATGLYNLASMLVGEGEDGIRLVEAAVADTEISVCEDQEQARRGSLRMLAAAALDILEQRNPGSLAAPDALAPAGSCIEEDYLEVARAAGVELERMIAGPDRERVRKWLSSLPTATRTVFVVGAVAGFTAAESARLLSEHGGPRSAGWTAEAVHIVFLQGLCSLTSQLIQASTVQISAARS
jgi:DNA-directed RNA polymerase specialized sigma24 family protein